MARKLKLMTVVFLIISTLLVSCAGSSPAISEQSTDATPDTFIDKGADTNDTNKDDTIKDTTPDTNKGGEDMPPPESDKVKTIYDITKTDGSKIKIACIGK